MSCGTFGKVETREDHKLFLVPRHMRKDLLQLAPDNTASGHLGREKTVERLRRNFHWPSLPADMEWYVKACAACNGSKHLNRRPKVPPTVFHSQVSYANGAYGYLGSPTCVVEWKLVVCPTHGGLVYEMGGGGTNSGPDSGN